MTVVGTRTKSKCSRRHLRANLSKLPAGRRLITPGWAAANTPSKVTPPPATHPQGRQPRSTSLAGLCSLHHPQGCMLSFSLARHFGKRVICIVTTRNYKIGYRVPHLYPSCFISIFFSCKGFVHSLPNSRCQTMKPCSRSPWQYNCLIISIHPFSAHLQFVMYETWMKSIWIIGRVLYCLGYKT